MLTPETFTTSNGIRTAVHEDPSLQYQSVALYVDTSDQPDAINEPHFMEHVLVRDPATFGTMSILQLAESTANDSNAATYPEVIEFSFKSVPGATPYLFPRFLQGLASPPMSQDSVETERDIIASEMRERDAKVGIALDERLMHNHGIVHTAPQETAGLASVDRDMLMDFHRRTLIGRNLFLVAAGPMSATDIQHFLETSDFTTDYMPSGGIGMRTFEQPRQPIVSGSETKKTTHFMAMYDTVADPAVDDILYDIISGDSPGTFWHRAVNEIGVYSAWLYQTPYPYLANARHRLRTEGTTEQVMAVDRMAREVLHAMAAQPPGNDDLARAKLKLHNQTIFSDLASRPGAHVHNMFRQLPKFPDIKSISENDQAVQQVTAEEVQALAQSLLDAPRTYSVVGSKSAIADIKRAIL